MSILQQIPTFHKKNYIISRYSLPNHLESDEEDQRFRNEDLRNLTDLQLWGEETKAKVALASMCGKNEKDRIVCIDETGRVVYAQEWLLKRLAAIRRERRRG